VPDLFIDGRPVSVPEGATLLDAAHALGMTIPTLCHQEGLVAARPHRIASCMVCMVEDEAAGRLVPSCATPAAQGQRVLVTSPRATTARRRAVELLLAEHAGDCEAPCTRACPAGVDIPGMIRRLASGDAFGALEIVMERLPLPGTMASVCPAPCRRSCRRRLIDSPVDICAIKRAVVAAGLGGDAPFTPSTSPSTAKTVAVIGAGPAGLSTAYFLARAGHHCIVFDEQAKPGGMLLKAVGLHQLAVETLQNDIAVLRRLGVELHMSHAVTPGETFERLRDSHDAVVIAGGSPEGLAVLLPAGGVAPGARGVFVAGNASRTSPTRMAVRAIADARKVARTVGIFLEGRDLEPAPARFDSHRGTLSSEDLAMLASRAARRSARGGGSGSAGIGGSAGVEAMDQARRCLECDCARGRSCRLRLLATELGADERRFRENDSPPLDLIVGRSGLSFEPGKCIKCGICVRIALLRGDRPGLVFVGRGADMRLAVPFNGDIGQALPRSAAACAANCPTGALVWDRRGGERGGA
jgi:ferredoxin